MLPPAIILAAGLGTRMRPLTNNTPKPLIEVAGKRLIDRVADSCAAAGCRHLVVNTHHLPEQMEAWASARSAPDIKLSPEIDERLETGGGIKKALPLLIEGSHEPFFSTNADSFWLGGDDTWQSLSKAFDPARMDMLLLVVRRENSVGLDGHKGDFSMDAEGRLARRGDKPVDWNYTGTAIMTPALFDATPDGPFSLNLLFDRAIATGRLYGHSLDGTWITVGTPEELRLAEEALAARAPRVT